MRKTMKPIQNKLSNWKVPNMWQDGSCWIIGGGPSMPRQFGVPESVIEKVAKKELPLSVFSDYMKDIHNDHIIGTNIAFLLGSWVSALFFCDVQPFFENNTENLKSFRNLKVTNAQNFNDKNLKAAKDAKVKILGKDYEPGLSTDPKVIKWNNNSGGAAINLASLMGVKRILLLGFDMIPNVEGKTHWHAQYNHKTDKKDFERFLKGFPFIQQHAKKLGIEILNVNKDSAIDSFKKVELKEVL